MECEVVLEIIPSGVNGWDYLKAKTVRFKNVLRAIRFAEYYTKMHKCLIKYSAQGKWRATYCDGYQIWNCYN